MSKDTLQDGKRIQYLDIAKGIGMLLVILGHCTSIPLWMNHFIFSVHMPLFFILSGFTFNRKNCNDIKGFVKKNFKSLVVPYMITAVIIILVKVIQAAVGQEDVLQEFIKWTVTALYGTGTHYLPVFDSLGIPITFIGAIWFLLALFFARVFFAWIMKTKTPVVWIMVFFAIGFISARKIGWLPFSFQAGMCDVLFLYIGLYIREHELFQWQKIHPVLKLLMLGIWGYCVCFCGKMWLVSNSFTDGFMDIIGSICGTFVIVYLSQGIEKIFHHPRILPWIGRNSLGIMCAHVIVLDCWPVWPHVRAILTKISLPKSVCEVLLIFSTTALVTVILYFIPRINRKLFPAGKS